MKKKEPEPDICMARERVDTLRFNCPSGIDRNTNGKADIDGKIGLCRKTAYSLMDAGPHVGSGLKATLGGHIWSTFVIPWLPYGLEALLLKQNDIENIEEFQRKCLKQIPGIPEIPLIPLAWRILPIKDILNKNLLNLFR